MPKALMLRSRYRAQWIEKIEMTVLQLKGKAAPRREDEYRVQYRQRIAPHPTVAVQTGWLEPIQTRRMVFTDVKKVLFLDALRTCEGSKKNAAKAIGIWYIHVIRHYKNDPEFALDCEDIITACNDLIRDQLRTELIRRGLEGTKLPVYSMGRRALDFVLDEDGKVARNEKNKPIMTPAFTMQVSDRCLIAAIADIDGMKEQSGSETSGEFVKENLASRLGAARARLASITNDE